MNPTLNAKDICGMSDQRLKQELAHRGLPAHGLQLALAERLKQAIDDPPLAQQLASTTMLNKIFDMLFAGDVESIRLWLDAGVGVDIANDHGRTPLYIASENGHAVVVASLLAAGATVDLARTDNSGTPLCTYPRGI